jgi:hypothetical protein
MRARKNMRKPLARASGDLPPHFQFMQLISVHLGVFIKLGLQRLART